jgi:4-amino-4-deoxy-L-arabinose transferase-like glycosyltransferase
MSTIFEHYRRRRFYYLLLAGIILAGLSLRIAPIARNRFHEDEALYSYWSLQIATGADPMLDRLPVDKPPLFFYLQALAFLALGRSEIAARVPSLIANMATLLIFAGLARRAYGQPAALLAAAALAFNPFDIAFAGTAFTDPLMVMLAVGALALILAGRPGWAGLCVGLAFAAKQQGVLFVPLIAGAGALLKYLTQDGHTWPGAGHSCRLRVAVDWLRAWRYAPTLRLFAGALLGTAPALVWDAFRTKRPGYLEQSVLSYGGLGIAAPATWAQRAGDWLPIVGRLFGSPLTTGLLAAGLALLLVADWRMLRCAASEAEQRRARLDLLWLGFCAAFLAGHWIISFNPWDRYLLGLVPLLSLLAARVALLPASVMAEARPATISPWAPRAAAGIGAALLVAALLAPAGAAARGVFPVGGDHGAYQGIELVADYVRRELPAGAIVHQRTLGWHFMYYLYGDIHAVHWYRSPDDLAKNVSEWPATPQWIVFPEWRGWQAEEARLQQAGIALREELRALRSDGSVSFRVFRLEPAESRLAQSAQP